MSNLPDKVDPSARLPEPSRLSNRDFEMVIKRAAELQARDVEGPDGDGIDEAEVVRIGRELGLSNQHLQRALAEVRGPDSQESGVFTRLFGPANVRVSRSVRGNATGVATTLERHLVDKEYMAVLRRLPDSVILTRASGAAAAVGRAMSKAFNRTPPLPVDNLEVTVRGLEDEVSYVSLATSLSGQRTITALSTVVGGGWGSGALAAFLGIAVAPPLALVGLPVFAGVMYGGRLIYSGVVQKATVQLESLVDRLEHGDLAAKPTTSFLPKMPF